MKQPKTFQDHIKRIINLVRESSRLKLDLFGALWDFETSKTWQDAPDTGMSFNKTVKTYCGLHASNGYAAYRAAREHVGVKRVQQVGAAGAVRIGKYVHTNEGAPKAKFQAVAAQVTERVRKFDHDEKHPPSDAAVVKWVDSAAHDAGLKPIAQKRPHECEAIEALRELLLVTTAVDASTQAVDAAVVKAREVLGYPEPVHRRAA